MKPDPIDHRGRGHVRLRDDRRSSPVIFRIWFHLVASGSPRDDADSSSFSPLRRRELGEGSTHLAFSMESPKTMFR